MENVINQSQEIATIITDFAKMNKIGKAKVQSFLIDVVKQLPRRKVSTGKPASDEALQLRDALRKVKAGESYTAVELAKQHKSTPIAVNNAIRYLAKTESKFSIVGAQKVAGKRGKPSLVWQAK